MNLKTNKLAINPYNFIPCIFWSKALQLGRCFESKLQKPENDSFQSYAPTMDNQVVNQAKRKLDCASVLMMMLFLAVQLPHRFSSFMNFNFL